MLLESLAIPLRSKISQIDVELFCFDMIRLKVLTCSVLQMCQGSVCLFVFLCFFFFVIFVYICLLIAIWRQQAKYTSSRGPKTTTTPFVLLLEHFFFSKRLWWFGLVCQKQCATEKWVIYFLLYTTKKGMSDRRVSNHRMAFWI